MWVVEPWPRGRWAPSPASGSHRTAEEGAAGWGLRRPRRKGGAIKKGKSSRTKETAASEMGWCRGWCSGRVGPGQEMQ